MYHEVNDPVDLYSFPSEKIRITKSILRAVNSLKEVDCQLRDYFKQELKNAIAVLMTGDQPSEQLFEFIYNTKEKKMDQNDWFNTTELIDICNLLFY